MDNLSQRLNQAGYRHYDTGIQIRDENTAKTYQLLRAVVIVICVMIVFFIVIPYLSGTLALFL